MAQPRSLELFEFLGIIDLVMQRSIKPPTARMYKGPEGVEILKEFLMIPDLEPTPDKPYVCEPLNSALVKTIERTNWRDVVGGTTAEFSSPWPGKFGKDNSNGNEEI